MTRADERSLIGRRVLGRYRILSELARGGMGAVYLARVEGAAGFRRPVVIKRVLPERLNEVHVSHFAREARILSLLRHPNIVAVLDFAKEDGIPLLALEYVHGYNLAQWARYRRRVDQPFSAEGGLYVVLEILRALDYAHRATDASGPLGVAHRDVKPANVLLDTMGHVKLVDFGIAFATDDRTTATDVTEEQVKGTYPYCAPELFEGERASPATDVYAVAVTLYELMAGQNPFAGDNMAHMIGQVLQHTPASLTTVRPEIPPQLSRIVDKALSKDPVNRFTTAAALIEALRASLPARSDVETVFRGEVHRDFSDSEFPRLARCRSLADIELALSRDFDGSLEEGGGHDGEPETEGLSNDVTAVTSGADPSSSVSTAPAGIRRSASERSKSVPDTDPDPDTSGGAPEKQASPQPGSDSATTQFAGRRRGGGRCGRQCGCGSHSGTALLRRLGNAHRRCRRTGTQ